MPKPKTNHVFLGVQWRIGVRRAVYNFDSSLVDKVLDGNQQTLQVLGEDEKHILNVRHNQGNETYQSSMLA
jgi:hypothetical protein